MNFQDLYEIQKILDDRIKVEHRLQDQNLIPSKLLALLVELGELANETKSFKYWSKKPSAEKAIILEEYVDCLHFILSLGLEYEYGSSDLSIERKGSSLVEQFNLVFAFIVALGKDPSEEIYSRLFKEFVELGNLLGFTREEIIQSYLEKNKVNHHRQNEGY